MLLGGLLLVAALVLVFGAAAIWIAATADLSHLPQGTDLRLG